MKIEIEAGNIEECMAKLVADTEVLKKSPSTLTEEIDAGTIIMKALCELDERARVRVLMLSAKWVEEHLRFKGVCMNHSADLIEEIAKAINEGRKNGTPTTTDL